MERILKVVLPFALALLLRYQFGLPESPPNPIKALFKILPIVVLIAAIQYDQRGSDYSARVTAGLCFSAAGDLCQLYKQEYFIFGVICFGIAYCMYAVAFTLHDDNFLLACSVCLAAGVACIFGSPKLQELAQPAAIAYTLTFLLMLWRALAWWKSAQNKNSSAALVGAATLVASNAVFSTHIFQFQSPVPHTELIVSSTYYMGQLLIALSAL
ncbi:lysoplasmalogenase TMEM86A-like [Scyliorhinus torazame]|uniref:lysoplasmalogenase n=1 Tax=Scyliorhinus torazame TaxID=75743 RepID=A0A401NJ39_SCYTO|nr:hypothetical protein [Scyliorhinus torazame]